MTEQTYQRIDLAQEQLDVALELFLNGRSNVSVITLAGAAEEIFGKTLFHRNEKTVLEREYDIVAPFKEFYRINKPRTWKGQNKPYIQKKLNDEENRVRNAVKHMDKQYMTKIIADLEDEACKMIIRACGNYDLLDLPKTDLMHKFEDWFYKHKSWL